MKQNCLTLSGNIMFLMLVSSVLLASGAFAQGPHIKDFSVFGTGLQLGTSSTVVSGNVGSMSIVRTTGTSSIGGSIYSKGLIDLANSNTVTGSVYAANDPFVAGNAFQTGSNASIAGSIFANGPIYVGGGSVNGSVELTSNSFSYSGPTPSGTVTVNPALTFPMPTLPGTFSIPAIPANKPDIVNNTTLLPYNGTDATKYGNIMLGGARTVTFSAPGTYIIRSIRNSGNFNKFVFNFTSAPSGIFKLYLPGDVDLFKINVELVGGGSPSQIYMEVQGNGQSAGGTGYAWSITNGASGNNQSTWLGTVWAPNGPISVGSGSSQSKIIGALWSHMQVDIQNGVSITHAALQQCNFTVDAGSDPTITCASLTPQLSGSTTALNPVYSWTTSDGIIVSGANTANPVISKAGTYTLTVTSPGCFDSYSDNVVVTTIPCVLPFYPPSTPGKVDLKIGSELWSLYNNYGNVLDDGSSMFTIMNG
ncbi:MAG TPA: hypothetical protein VFZ78_09120, partial [Flavisolibacter sp.]